MPIFSAEELRGFAHRLLAAVGASGEEAETVAQVLVSANLAGHDSHGVIRIEQYVRMIREGRIVPGAPFEIVRRAPAAARATRLAMEMAHSTGLAAVSVRGCNHVSRLGHYVLMAADAGLVGMMTAN